MFRFPLFLAALLALALQAPAAESDPYEGLRADPVLTSGLRWIAVADRIRKNCPDISARTFRALGYINSLMSHARDLGYDRSTIRAFVDDNAEQDRVKSEAMAYLVQQGVEPDDQQSYCTVGQSEIARRSQIGVLLR